MLAIHMLPAGHGDALVIEYGSRKSPRRVLVDAGTVHSWNTGVRPRIAKLPEQRFEAFIVTHIDEDHIGGAIRILDDTDLRYRIKDIWFNGFTHCATGYRDDVLGPIDGERLTYRIGQGKFFRWNQPFAGEIASNVGGPVVVADPDRLPKIELPGDAVVHLLSPTQPKLDRLAEVWERVVTKAGLKPGRGTPIQNRPPPVHQQTPPSLPVPLTCETLRQLAKSSRRDRSQAKGSSIAFIFEHEGRRALLGADAHPDVLVQSLHVFARSIGKTRVPLDLVKLPHHGSKQNVSTALINVIDARRYLISTNGDNFGHPDHAAIARVILASSKPPTFYCNYRSAGTTGWEEHGPAVGATFILPKNENRPGLRVSATA